MGKEEIGVTDASSFLERSAIKLALSETREEEEALKSALRTSWGLVCAATEIGGTMTILHHKGKLTNSVLAAALHTGVIKKEEKSIHALLHATLEASNSVFIHSNSNASFALKVGIATDKDWIAIAIFGRTSVHPLSEHARIGLGLMHL